MIEFLTKWRDYKPGDTGEFSPALENRLERLKVAKKVKGLDVDQRVLDAGFDTVEKILESDLTQIPGIGAATEEKIKEQVRELD